MNQSERQHKLLETLCRRRHDTCGNLAEEFHVSKATIFRDVENLMRSYPIETVRGRYGGGIRVADGYYLNRSSSASKALNSRQTALLRGLRKYVEGDDLTTLNEILILFAP